MKNYRFDKRTEAQFKKDIRDFTRKENELLELFIKSHDKKLKYRRIKEDGADGEYLTDEQVSIEPDFWVEDYGLVEVKFAKPMLKKCFHLKVGQMKKYESQNATILMVNGVNTDSPQFTLIKPKKIKWIIKTCEEVPWGGFGGKLSYKIPVDAFKWQDLM